MRFQYFNSLYLLVAVAVLAGVWLTARHGKRRRERLLHEFVGPDVLPKVVKNVSAGKRRLRNWLLGAGVVFVLIALARPQWGSHLVPHPEQSRDILLTVDVSRSMLAADTAPSRLRHAKWLIRQIVGRMPGDRFGIIAFAGDAYIECPLTQDRHTLFTFLDDIDTQTAPVGGTNISKALEAASAAFEGAESQNNAVVMFTDGDELQGDASELVGEFREGGIPLIIAGIGNPDQPSPVTLPDGSYLRDQDGEIVSTRLNQDKLRELAGRTDGLYVHSTAVNPRVWALSDRLLALIPEQTGGGETMRPIERYQIPLALGVFLLLLRLFIGERTMAPRRVAAAVLLVAASLMASFAASAQEQPADEPVRAPGAGSRAPAAPDISDEKRAELEEMVRSMQEKAEDAEGVQKARAYYNQGVALHELGRDDEAREAYNKALDHSSPSAVVHSWALWNLGVLTHAAARELIDDSPEEAIEKLDRVKGYYREALRNQPALDQLGEQFGKALAVNLEIALRDRQAAAEIKAFDEAYQKLLEKARQQVIEALHKQEETLNVQDSSSRDEETQAALQETRQTRQTLQKLTSLLDAASPELLEKKGLAEQQQRFRQALGETANAIGKQEQSRWRVWAPSAAREHLAAGMQHLERAAELLGVQNRQQQHQQQDQSQKDGQQQQQPQDGNQNDTGQGKDEQQNSDRQDSQPPDQGGDLGNIERPPENGVSAQAGAEAIDQDQARALLLKMMQKEEEFRERIKARQRHRLDVPEVEKDW